MRRVLRAAACGLVIGVAVAAACWLMLAAVVGLFWYPVVIAARILEAM